VPCGLIWLARVLEHNRDIMISSCNVQTHVVILLNISEPGPKFKLRESTALLIMPLRRVVQMVNIGFNYNKMTTPVCSSCKCCFLPAAGIYSPQGKAQAYPQMQMQVHQWCAHLASESESPQLLKPPRTRRWRTMGRTFRTMSTRTLMSGHFRIGNRIPRFPVFGGDFPKSSGFNNNKLPTRIGRESGIGKRAVSRFGREPGIGVPGRQAGGFLVCAAAAAAGRTGGRGAPLTPGLGVVSKYSRRSANSETIERTNPRLVCRRVSYAPKILAYVP
jgi:hypothetical protein